jgi:hypothetical protein
MLKKVLLVLGIALLGIQLVRPARNHSDAPAGPNHIYSLYPASPEVKTILAKACNDCHSDSTRYPWYAEIQPVGWWLASHVNDGKRHLNFSQFGTYPGIRAARKMTKTIDETEEHEMPLASYTLIHRDARLTEAEQAVLATWARDVRSRLPK